jgi:hypothetical protein
MIAVRKTAMVANPRAANISSPLLVLVGASSGAAFAVFRIYWLFV